MGPFLAILTSDLRQRLRDRSVLVFGLVVPVGLMTVFSLLFGGLDEGPDLDATTVAASVPEGDGLGAVVVEVLTGLDVMEVTVDPADGAEAVEQLVRGGEADVGLVVPEGFAAAVAAGEPTDVRLVEGDDDGFEADVVAAVVQGTVDEVAAGAVAARAAGAEGVDPGRLEDIGRAVSEAGGGVDLVQGRASDEQLSLQANLVAGQAGLFMLFTVGFGVLALLYEKEAGTLRRLRSVPVRWSIVVAAKAAVSLVLGVGATAVLLVVGSLLFGVSFGSPVAVGVLVVAAVAAATSLVFVIARVATTSEQAGVAQSILAIVLGIAGGAFFPLQATGIVGRLLDLSPVAAFTWGLGITAGGGGLGDIGTPLATLAAFALVALVVSRLVPDRGGLR